MGKHTISKSAICPFYKYEGAQVIYCYGIQKGSATHVAFSDRDAAHSYKKEHCRSDYEKCRIYRMLEEGGGSQ